MEARYARNAGLLTEEQQRTLWNKKVLVAGCGGLGGYVIELLARSGVGSLVVCDCDVFDETNLNRQLLATVDTIGHSKAEAAAQRIRQIYPQIQIRPSNIRLDANTIPDVIRGCDLVVDALDNLQTRFALEDACTEAGIPFLYGGVNGWFGCVGTILPGCGTLKQLYQGMAEQKAVSVLGVTVAATAAAEAAEAIKILLDCPELVGKLLMMDLKKNRFDIMEWKASSENSF